MSLTRPAAITLALAAVTALSACTSSEDATEQANAGADTSVECPWAPDESVTGKVRVAFQIIPTGDLIVKDQGILEACLPEADIVWTQYASGGDVVQAFASGSVDIGTVGSSPSVKALSAPLDLDVKVVWIQDVIGEAEALAAKESDSVADLKGAKIGVPFSSTAHFSLLAALGDAGLDPAKDVEVINLAPEAILGAWQAGEIDAAYTWDPTLSELLADGTKLISGTQIAEIGAPTFDLSVADAAFAEANPAFLETWTKAQDWAVQLINEDPAAAAESLAVEVGSESGTIEAQLAGTTYLTASEQLESYFDGKLGTVMAETAAFLAEQGEIDSVADVAHYTKALHVDALEALK